ncbi:MAG: hypothetical protein H6642_15250 [Caldilineaceae bacterium]|nr:hypothetical protein [Caldilineaceae bacterium]
MSEPPARFGPQLNARLRNLSNDDLLALLGDLYALHEETRRYLAARFTATTPDERSAPYRKLIARAFASDGSSDIDVSIVRAALTEFALTGAGAAEQIDLMLFYVEEGIGWIETYGVYASAYAEVSGSLLDVYEQAAAALTELDRPAFFGAVQSRFLTINQEAESVDWGLYEYFVDIYINYVDPGDEETWVIQP